MTGSDVTSPKAVLTGTRSHGSDRVCMRNRFPRFSYHRGSTKCSTVVQVSWLPEVINFLVIFLIIVVFN